MTRQDGSTARSLVYWCNSLGPRVAPSALLADSVQDLVDGIAVCEIARSILETLPDSRTVQQLHALDAKFEGNVCNGRDAQQNLMAAGRVACSLDQELSWAACKELAETGDVRGLVLSLLQSFQKIMNNQGLKKKDRVKQSPRRNGVQRPAVQRSRTDSAVSSSATSTRSTNLRQREKLKLDLRKGSNSQNESSIGSDRLQYASNSHRKGGRSPRSPIAVSSNAEGRNRAAHKKQSKLEFSRGQSPSSPKRQARGRSPSRSRTNTRSCGQKSKHTSRRRSSSAGSMLSSRPAWNISVKVPDMEDFHGQDQFNPEDHIPRAKVRFRHGSLVDPIFKSKDPVPVPHAREASSPRLRLRPRVQPRAPLQRAEAFHIDQVSESRSPPALGGRITAEYQVLGALQQLATDTKLRSLLHVQHRETLRWLLEPEGLPKVLQRFQHFHVSIGLDLKALDISQPFLFGAKLFQNGVLLCELVRRLEQEAGRKHPCVEKACQGPGNKTRKMLLLLGMTLQPKTHGAKAKNFAVALGILQSRPSMSVRHLYNAERLVNGHPPAAIWELLHDIRDHYGHFQPQVAPRSPKGAPALERSQQPVSARNRSHSLSSVDSRRLNAWPDTLVKRKRSGSFLSQQSLSESGSHSSHVVRRRSNSFSHQARSSSDPHAPPVGLLVGPEQASDLFSSLPKECTKRTKDQHPTSSGILDQINFLPEPPALVTGTDPKIPESKVKELILWVLSLKLDGITPSNLAEAADTPLLKDPLRNGMFLYQLLAKLEPKVLRYIKEQGRPPQSVAQAVDLVSQIYKAMYMVLLQHKSRKYPKLLEMVRASPDVLVRGDRDVLWRLVATVREYSSQRRGSEKWVLNSENDLEVDSDAASTMQTKTERLDKTYDRLSLDMPCDRASRDIFPSRITRSQSDNSLTRGVENQKCVSDHGNQLTSPQLVYSAEVLDALETSLTAWLFRAGLIPKATRTLFELERVHTMWCSGVLLANIIERQLQNGVPVKGVFKKPKTQSTSLKNFTKCLEALRLRKDIGRRFLFCAEALQQASRVPTIGLLEDIRRAEDGIAIRPMRIQPGREETPHFGENGAPRTPSLSPRRRRLSSPKPGTPASIGLRRNAAADIWPNLSEVASFRNRTALSSNPPLPRPGTSHSVASLPSASSILAPREPESVWSGLRDIIPVPGGGMMEVETKIPSEHHDMADDTFRYAGQVNAPPNPTATLFVPSVHGQDPLLKWLTIKHRLPLREPEKLCQGEGVSSEFVDGTLLCSLVEHLEHIRGGIPGVQLQPKTSAACLHNIRSALQILQGNPKMSTTHLWSEREIAQGQNKVLVPLLTELMRVYG